MTWTFDKAAKTKADLVKLLRRAERFADNLMVLKTSVVGMTTGTSCPMLRRL